MTQRIIKFRVWDTYNERMIMDPYRFRENTDQPEIDARFDTPWQYVEDWQDDDDGVWRPCYVMQFTGMKDKNGVEIYEGDVCRFSWNPILNQPGTLFQYELPVKYYIGWGCFVFHIESKKMKKMQRDMFTDYGMEERYLAIGTPIMYNEEGGGVEVIGNVWEQPIK